MSHKQENSPPNHLEAPKKKSLFGRCLAYFHRLLRRKPPTDSTAPIHLEKENDEIEVVEVGDENSEIIKFTSYNKLPVELRHAVLLRLDENTRQNYAECSNFCNMEVQKLITTTPYQLYLFQQDDDIIVQFRYLVPRREPSGDVLSKFKTFNKKFFVTDEDDQPYLFECSKFAKTATFQGLSISLRKWPSELMKIVQLAKVEWLQVIMYKSMIEDFMEYAKTYDSITKELTILSCVNPDEKVILPSELFRYSSIKNLQRMNFGNRCSIELSDFVNLRNPDIVLQNSIDFEAIRQKVNKINADENNTVESIILLIPYDDLRVFDFQVLFPIERFPDQRLETRFSYPELGIGKVIVTIYSRYNSYIFHIRVIK